MICTAAANSARSSGRVRASYIEISKFIRASCSGPKPWSSSRAPRFLHVSRSLGEIASNKPNKPFIEAYKDSISFPAATVDISSLDSSSETPEGDVVLHGYLGPRHDLSKKLFFLSLLNRDLSHSVQVVSSISSAEGSQQAHEQIKHLSLGTPVVITGRLRPRKEVKNSDSGEIKKIMTKEIQLHSIQSLNEFPKDIIVDDQTNFPPEQRHLQLRQEKSLRDALKWRSDAATFCRNWLDKARFTEVETPLLFKSTPEGAREFIVPTRRKGLAYALPQSPQQFKQILMGSGISRYYQFARCFRDEDLRADRQPEFTQLDLEMAFASGEDVMQCIESLIRVLWKTMLHVDLPSPFPRMTYHDAMSTYGSDKPDVRLGMPIQRIDHVIPADLVSKISRLTLPAVDLMRLPLGRHEVEFGTARKFIGDFLESSDGQPFTSNLDGAPGVFIYNSAKPLSGLQPFGFEAAEMVEELLQPEDGDILILQARTPELSGGSTSIGNLRLALHREAVAKGLLPPLEGFAPLWITDFPLFSAISASEPGQGGSAGLASTHHPFTSPKTPEDVDLLVSEPRKVIADHYDIVMNGAELGGGSRRIHQAEMQKYIMEEILKMSGERIAEFKHLLEVLRAGCPPHAGIALGFDRLIAVMLGKESVRDVIAFPKSGRGEDPLVKSPGSLTEEALSTYHLKLR